MSQPHSRDRPDRRCATEAPAGVGVDGGRQLPPDHDPGATLAHGVTPEEDPQQREDVLRRLGAVLPDGLDLQSEYTAFREATGSANLDDFLAHLHEQEVIDTRSFLGAHAVAEIELWPISGTGSAAAVGHVELGHVGEGGLGLVSVAKDQLLRRRVAVKRLKDAGTETPLTERRFVKEAQITAQLDHPNIIPIYAFQGAGDRKSPASFSMKLIHGDTLASIIETARTRLEETPPVLDDAGALRSRLEYFLKVCDAMSYAHNRGVIHRDLKPDNIMVGEYGEVYVMDWGVARFFHSRDQGAPAEPSSAVVGTDAGGGDALQTLAGQLVGTPLYMSPEQARGEHDRLDQRSDVCALGLILFELCTLRRAIGGTTLYEVLSAAIAGDREPFRHLHPRRRISKDLEAIVDRATRPDPVERYPDVAALAADVRRYLHGDEVSVRPDNLPRKVLRWATHHRQVTLTAVLLVGLALSVSTIWSLTAQRDALAAQRDAVEATNTAIQAGRLREQRITAWLSSVAAHSAVIDREFLRIETMVTGLSRAASFWLSRGQEAGTGERLFGLADYEDPARAPPDYRHSPLYDRAISIDYPVYKLAPGVSEEEVLPKLRRLAPLRHFYQQLFLDSWSTTAALDEAQIRARLTEQGVLLRWAYVGLAEGVMFSYPGKTGYPPEYDPRVRPWYELGEGHRDVRWGNPYIDLQGQGLILPAVTSLYSPSGELLGVVGLEMTFDQIIEAFMRRAGATGVREAFLLDDRGRTVIRSSQFQDEFAGGELHGAMELPLYPVEGVVQAIAAGGSGHLEVQGNLPTLIVYRRIPTLGWYYVEEVDAGTLLREGGGR
jgi:serine/threonine-protein kinase